MFRLQNEYAVTGYCFIVIYEVHTFVSGGTCCELDYILRYECILINKVRKIVFAIRFGHIH